jgi:transposase
MPKPFPDEFRQMVIETAKNSDEPKTRIARDFGISESCLHRWLQLDGIEAGERPGQTQADKEEVRELKRKVKVLEEENLILRRAAAFFAKEITPK